MVSFSSISVNKLSNQLKYLKMIFFQIVLFRRTVIYTLTFSSFLSLSVIYIVDLRKEVYYQKCHDPDCRGLNESFPHFSLTTKVNTFR